MAVIVNVVVAATGGFAEPEAGSVTPSSGGSTAGLMVTAVAFVVAQVMVEVWPAFTDVGFAVKEVTWGGTGCATATVMFCVGVLDPELPLAMAL